MNAESLSRQARRLTRLLRVTKSCLLRFCTGFPLAIDTNQRKSPAQPGGYTPATRLNTQTRQATIPV